MEGSFMSAPAPSYEEEENASCAQKTAQGSPRALCACGAGGNAGGDADAFIRTCFAAAAVGVVETFHVIRFDDSGEGALTEVIKTARVFDP